MGVEVTISVVALVAGVDKFKLQKIYTLGSILLCTHAISVCVYDWWYNSYSYFKITEDEKKRITIAWFV